MNGVIRICIDTEWLGDISMNKKPETHDGKEYESRKYSIPGHKALAPIIKAPQ
jgi:hypothetical protein